MASALLFDEKYLLRHQRTDSLLQRILPETLVQEKEKWFAWAQVLYLSRMCEYLDPNCCYDIGLIKPGLPYLTNILRRNNISTLTFENQPELLTSVDAKVGQSSGDVIFLEDLVNQNRLK